MIDQVLRLLRPVLPASLEINTLIEADDVRVVVDAVQFQQLIMNLCVNARDATGADGAITIRLAKAEELSRSLQFVPEYF